MPMDWKERNRCSWCRCSIKDGESAVKDKQGWLHDACETEMLDIAEGKIVESEAKLGAKFNDRRRRNARKIVARSVP
jgi:hypothetical protein